MTVKFRPTKRNKTRKTVSVCHGLQSRKKAYSSRDILGESFTRKTDRTALKVTFNMSQKISAFSSA